ncbi:MAG: Gfo/Idh/MocA family protein [Halobacteriales archaeon]
MPPAVGYVGLDHPHRDAYLDLLADRDATVTCACEPDDSFDAGDVDLDVPLYRDPGDLLAAEAVDAVWVTLPNRDTPAVVADALAAGVDVFAEKPMARTADDLEPVAEAAADSAATLAVAYANRAHPAARALRERLRAGVLGELRAVEARLVATTLDGRLAGPGRYTYRADASRGGILQWLGCHWLDLIEWATGDPIERVAAGTFAADATDVEAGMVLQWEAASGALGSLSCGYHLDARKDTTLRIYGEEGRATTSLIAGEHYTGETRLTVERHGGGPAPRREIVYDHEPASGYLGRVGGAFVDAFFAACRGERETPAGLGAARRTLAVMDAAYEAAATDEWVAVASQS